MTTAPSHTVEGDFAKLAALKGKLRAASLKALAKAVAKDLAPEVVRLARDGAARSVDPYGGLWPGRTDGEAATLRPVLASLRARTQGLRVHARVAHAGARIHQYGGVITPKRKAGGRGGYRMGKALRFTVGGAVVFARKVVMPRRQYMPEKDGGLGAPWSEAFARVTDAAVAAFMKGAE